MTMLNPVGPRFGQITVVGKPKIEAQKLDITFNFPEPEDRKKLLFLAGNPIEMLSSIEGPEKEAGLLKFYGDLYGAEAVKEPTQVQFTATHQPDSLQVFRITSEGKEPIALDNVVEINEAANFAKGLSEKVGLAADVAARVKSALFQKLLDRAITLLDNKDRGGYL